MDTSTLIAAIIQALFGCAIVFFVLKFFRQKQIDQHREDIKKLEAKMSSFRMLLRAKVKKKAQFYRATMPQAIRQGDPIDNSANELCDLAFEQGADFEKYFDLSKQLNNFLKIGLDKAKAAAEAKGVAAPETSTDAKSSSVTGVGSNSEFMTADIKNEFTIIKIMNEMVDLSHKIKSRIESYNLNNTKSSLPVPETIHFKSLPELKRIFSSASANAEDIKVAS